METPVSPKQSVWKLKPKFHEWKWLNHQFDCSLTFGWKLDLRQFHTPLISLGGEGWESFSVGHCSSSFFDNSTKNNCQALSGTFAPSLYRSFNHCPSARPARVAESSPRARLQVLQNSGSRMFLLKVEVLVARDRHWRNLRGKNRKSSNTKARVSVHWRQRRAHCHTKWPRGCREFQHPAGFKTTPPDSLQLAITTKPGVRQSIEKWGHV